MPLAQNIEMKNGSVDTFPWDYFEAVLLNRIFFTFVPATSKYLTIKNYDTIIFYNSNISTINSDTGPNMQILM